MSNGTNRQWSAVSEYERPLTLYATRILGDVGRAQDVVQETFLRLFSQNPFPAQPFVAQWLYTVCRNKALDIRRKEKRMNPLSDSHIETLRSADPPPPEILESREKTSQVMKALDGLPENQQEVIRLKFQHGRSYKEISEITNLSVSNVGVLIHKGLKSIRAQVANA